MLEGAKGKGKKEGGIGTKSGAWAYSIGLLDDHIDWKYILYVR